MNLAARSVRTVSSARAVVLGLPVALLAAACAGDPPAPQLPPPQPTASNVVRPAPLVVPPAHGGAAVPVVDGDVTWGQATAPLTLVVFGTCGIHAGFFDSKFATGLRKDLGQERLRIVLKHAAGGPERLAVLGASIHVERGLDGYLEFCRAAVKDSLEFAPDATLEEAERRLAIPDDVREKGEAKARADRALARKLLLIGRNSLPSGFFANGRWVHGSDDDERRHAVDDELAATKDALAKGSAREAIYVERVLANYEVEAVLPAEMRERWLAPVDGLPARGPADARVTVVEWGDYQCPFCRRSHETVLALEKKFAGKIRYVFRHKPLPFHKGALELAALALEARAQKGDTAFFAVHDALMAGKGDAIVLRPLYDAREALDAAKRKGEKPAIKEAETKLKEETEKVRPSIETVAKELGLDPKKTATAVLGGAWDGSIELDEQAGDDAGVGGTPTFLLNGRKIVGAQPEELFAALFDLELGAPSKSYAELQKGAKKRTRELPKLDGDPQRGPKTAKITLDVYCNYSGWFSQCGARAFEVREIEAQYRGQVRVVWHALRAPGEADAFVVTALHEAREQKGDAGFFKLNDAILAVPAAPDRQTLEALAKKAGLDGKKLAAALDARKFKETEEARAREARAANMLGSTIVFEGRVVGDRLKRAVALAAKRK